MLSVVILAILVVVLSRIVTSASTIVTLGNKRMDSDTQARLVFDRMAADFGQMIKRTDVDFYAKGGSDPEIGNDRIAFFSQMPGYYPTNGNQSPLSLVAYRINALQGSSSYDGMERMGKGLLWSAVSPTPTRSPVPSPNGIWIIYGGSPTLQTNWPSATLGDPSDPNYKDPDFELIGPQIFRFEYFYVLKEGTLTDGLTPIAVAPGMQNVSAITAVIGAIDPKSRVLLSNNQIDTLAGTMHDFSSNMHQPGNTTTQLGDLAAQWQSAIEATTSLPQPAISGVRVYQRTFYLLPSK